LDAPPNEPTVARELRALLVLSSPITVAQLLTMTLGLVETAIVGRVSTTELHQVARQMSADVLRLLRGDS